MIRVALCEDERAQSEYIAGLIRQFQERCPGKFILDIYESAERCLFAEEDVVHDLFILDIQLGEMNGMELARRIRKENARAQILFITGLREYALEGYEVGAVRYLIKPVREEEFLSLMDEIFASLSRREAYLVLSDEGQTRKVPFSEIEYVEAMGHYLMICAGEKTYRWKTSLVSVSEELEKNDFMLTRRGLYANLCHMDRLGKRELVMDSGTVLPVSKSRYRELNESFIAYYKRREEGTE